MCEKYNELEQKKVAANGRIKKEEKRIAELEAEIELREAKLPEQITSEKSFTLATEEIGKLVGEKRQKENFIALQRSAIASYDIEMKAILDDKKTEDILDVIEILKANVDKFIKQLKRPSETFKEIQLLVTSLFNSGPEVKEWPSDVFQYKKPHELTRHFLMCALADVFEFSSREKLEVPSKATAEKGKNFDHAFKDFVYVRDLWRHPERFIEVPPEDIEWEAATEVDFNEDGEDDVIEDKVHD